MAKQVEAIAAVYADSERAGTILNMLEEMNKAHNIALQDAVAVAKDADGKVQITETREVSGSKGAKRGLLAGAVVGVIFPPSLLVGAVAGGGLGAVWGKLRDTGIKTGKMEELANKLEPGKAAVIALVEQDSVPAVEKAMQGYDGELLKHAFSETETAHIEEAAATPPS
jgi:uncharacterized membrane protein